ncbi:MAG: pyridoxal phosphate-dependent aminotransferase [Clostridiaceae bacterium]|jgi:aspartate aminotransferase|nr:pyridoxal phosphate-dependent aminotransferase [Clostridiaceae bacterium]
MMISERVKQVAPSQTLELNKKVAEGRAEGRNIIALNSGEPDFNTPAPIIEAAHRAMLDGKTKYTEARGTLALREAIASKLKNDNRIAYTPDDVIVTTGAKFALFAGLLALCNPGDEVIVSKPCWVSYVEMIRLAEAVPVTVPVNSDWSLDTDAIEAAVTAKTRVIIINSPNNPTGAVYSEDSLRRVADIVERHNLFLISDEVYEKLKYTDKPHVSLAAFSEDIKKRTLTVNGFSKTYAMTGWRVGYAAGPRDVIRSMSTIQSHATSNVATFSQWAAIEAFRSCDVHVEYMRKTFEERRDYAYGRLQRLPGVHCTLPEGAFYLFPDVSGLFGKSDNGRVIVDAPAFAEYLLDTADVALVPGNAFESPEGIRLSYAVSMETLIDAMDRIEAAVYRLK